MEKMMRLKEIFKNTVELDFDKMDAIALDKNFLGKHLELEPRDLVYLLDAIEREFNLTIPQKTIAEGKFSTFNNIYSIINSQMR